LSVQKPISVGWIVDPKFGEFAFDSPTSLKESRTKPLSNRAIQACPAVNQLERRVFEINCPFNIHLEIEKNNNKFDLFIVDDGTRLDEDLIRNFVTLMSPDIWRNPDIPVLQIAMPYFFICDENCYMTQLPPYMEMTHRKWPGLMTSGRFPITNWPRVLNWAFEWTDTSNSLRLKRGDPMFYVTFETEFPDRPIKLVRAKRTKDLEEFRKGIEGMPKFVSNTFKIMETAKERRPKNLLVEADKNA